MVLILASFVASRTAISEAGDVSELRAQKWLLYLSLIAVYGFVLLALLMWPLILIPVAEEYEDSMSRFSGDSRYWVTAMSAILAVLGTWWCILAVVLLKSRRVVRVLFGPFTNALRRKWVHWLLATGLAVALLSAAVGAMYYRHST